MKVELLAITPDVERVIEIAGRTCYKSKLGSPEVIQSWIRKGHTSVIEHGVATFRMTDVSRAFTHQLVRHRMASYSQQSQRYTSALDFKDLSTIKLANGDKRSGKCLFSIIDEEKICEQYEAGYTSSDLADVYGCHPTTILSILRVYNKEVRSNDASSKGVVQNYFDIIDSELKAQIVGFIYADGCICDNSIYIDQAEENYATLAIIRHELKPSGNIFLENAETDTNQNCYRLTIGSIQLVNSLKKLGIHENKSKTICMEMVYNNIPEPYRVAFLRGIFEGDGHIGLKNPNSIFVISGNESTCTFYRNILVETLGLKETKINKNANNNCQMQFSGNKVVTKIMEYLYQGASPMFFSKKLFRAADLSITLHDKYDECVQQYCHMFQFTCPESIYKDYTLFNKYTLFLDKSQQLYKRMLMSGVKKEDARFVLPNAANTEIVVSLNFRSLRNLFQLRLDSHTQWEFRQVANEMLKLVKPLAPNVFFDIDIID
jgi:thymidylate synthase (FAD)